LVVVVGALCALGSKAEAQFNYSNWSNVNGTITFGPGGGSYTAFPWKIFTANPDQAKGYFCENFGFFNCQVTPAGNTWLMTYARCYSGAIGGSTSSDVQSAWSTSIPSVTCPAGYPNLGEEWIKVASVSYSNFSYGP
jgi:hypothetical protein